MKHLKAVMLVEPQLSTQNLSENVTVPLGGKFSPVFEKGAEVIFKLGTGPYLSPGGNGGGGRVGEGLGLDKVKFSRSPL